MSSTDIQTICKKSAHSWNVCLSYLENSAAAQESISWIHFANGTAKSRGLGEKHGRKPVVRNVVDFIAIINIYY